MSTPKYFNESQSLDNAVFIAKQIKKAGKVSKTTGNILTRQTDGLYVPASRDIIAQDLISADANNDLKLGSDNKLLSSATDTDFLANYIIASN